MTHRTDQPSTQTILVIEDEADIRELLRLALNESGYLVHTAHEGSRGLTIARQGDCALAIVDLFMPGKEGLETILALRREIPAMKLIAISGGSGDTDMLTAAKSFGADLTIYKPFDLDRLLCSVATLLQTR